MANNVILNGQNGRKIAYVTAPGPWATLANLTGTIAGFAGHTGKRCSKPGYRYCRNICYYPSRQLCRHRCN